MHPHPQQQRHHQWQQHSTLSESPRSAARRRHRWFSTTRWRVCRITTTAVAAVGAAAYDVFEAFV